MRKKVKGTEEKPEQSAADIKNEARIVKLKSGERVFVTRGIFDYFDDKNFPRLLSEYEYAKKAGVRFYVGLYSDELLERTGKTRGLKGKVSDQDRVNLLEAIDFVDGAFIISELTRPEIMKELEFKILQQRAEEPEPEDHTKKYEIGYASGGFSNLHKGHIEHLKEMKRQCKTTIVAVNSDRLLQEYKHKTASVNQDVRRCILSHVRYVDMAVVTDDYDKLKALEAVKTFCGSYFDAIFAGSDWMGDPKWEEFEKKLNAMGIDVVFTDRPQNGISTTAIDELKKTRIGEKAKRDKEEIKIASENRTLGESVGSPNLVGEDVIRNDYSVNRDKKTGISGPEVDDEVK